MIEKILDNASFLEKLSSGNICQFQFLQVPIDLLTITSVQTDVLFLYIQNNIRKMCDYPVYIFTTSKVFLKNKRLFSDDNAAYPGSYPTLGTSETQPSKRFLILAFENVDDSINTKNWLHSFMEDYQEWPLRKKTEQYPGKESFDEMVNRGDAFQIAATVPFSIDAEVGRGREIWNWVHDNCNGTIWYWDKKFRFEEADDATRFKLSWC